MGTLLDWAQVFIFKCYESKITNGSGSSVVIYAAQEAGKTLAIVSLALWLNLSGKVTSYSTTKSPRRSGDFGRGRPSPVTCCFIPGRIISWVAKLILRPSSVGTLIVQPQSAWEGRDKKRLERCKETTKVFVKKLLKLVPFLPLGVKFLQDK